MPAASPEPEPVADAHAALANGVDKLCTWFVRGKDYSLPNARAAALAAGFRSGASVGMVPLVEMQAQPSYSTKGFQARIANAPPEGSGVAAFYTFHFPVCQLQVFNYQSDAERFVAELPSRGWRHLTKIESANVRSDRWVRSTGEVSTTLVVNKWINEQPAPGGLGFILNILPGENRDSGAMQ